MSLAEANLVDPAISVTARDDFTFTLSARGGVAPFTWIDHPSGTVGVFKDNTTGLPLNGFYLIPGQDRTREQSIYSCFSYEGELNVVPFVA